MANQETVEATGAAQPPPVDAKATKKQDAPPAGPHPNQAKYADGHVFGYNVEHYQKYNDDELKAQGYNDTHITIIHEALDYFKLEPEALREARLEHAAKVREEGR